MTEKEMLELAAKAYWHGTDVSWHYDENEQAIVFIDADNQDHNGNDVELVWNPPFDGDAALRLAVKLQIHIQPDPREVWATTVEVTAIEHYGDDHFASACRAITRAAAEIGKAMP